MSLTYPICPSFSADTAALTCLSHCHFLSPVSCLWWLIGGWCSCWLCSCLHCNSRSGPGDLHCVQSPSFLPSFLPSLPCVSSPRPSFLPLPFRACLMQVLLRLLQQIRQVGPHAFVLCELFHTSAVRGGLMPQPSPCQWDHQVGYAR